MKPCAPARWGIVFLIASAFASAQQAPIPMAGELPGRPFAIQNKWVIGGVGDWGYLTLDPAARQLFIAHGSTVQIVDIDSGTLAATLTGFGNARQVVLSPDGQEAYVPDGQANLLRIINRRTLEIDATIPVAANPTIAAFEPSTGLLFVFGTGEAPTTVPVDQRTLQAWRRLYGKDRKLPQTQKAEVNQSLITVIDIAKRTKIAEIRLFGHFGMAQADADGHVFVDLTESNLIARLDANAIVNAVEQARKMGKVSPGTNSEQGAINSEGIVDMDWSGLERNYRYNPTPYPELKFFYISSDCHDPRGLALDAPHKRLFLACDNQIMSVMDTERGRAIASLTIGPGADAIAYDPARSLIFTANGGGYGSLSVVQQHITDDYAVIQSLPTLANARTMAVDPSTGEVYLVTTLYGAKLGNPPSNGIGKLKMDAISGSFQVLVIGR